MLHPERNHPSASVPPTPARAARSAALLLLCTGCVAYHDDPASLPSIAAEVAARHGGSLDWATAVERAWATDPALRAADAELAAARAARRVPLDATGEWRDGMETFALLVDPIALLGLGPRGGALDVAAADAVTALAERTEARWRALAEITEIWLVDRALRDLPTLDAAPPAPAQAFAAAGLASPLAAARLDAALAMLAAERSARELARQRNLARLRQRLGLDATAALEPVPGCPELDPATIPAQVLRRPDLAVPLARFRAADAAFRARVAEQYPALRIGPELSYGGDPVELMGMLQIPLLRGGVATAAAHRREAARARLEAAWIAAHNAAEVARLEHDRSAAALGAARARAAAAARALALAAAALDVEVDAFDAYADAAMEAAMAGTAIRDAALAEAGARAALAVARGWPIGDARAVEVQP